MKESYDEELAIRIGPDPYAGGGNTAGVASVRGNGRPAMELRNQSLVRRPCGVRGKATRPLALWQAVGRHGGVVEPVHAGKLQTREPGDPIGFRDAALGTVGKRLRRYSRHVRQWEVRWSHSTCEAGEQNRSPGGGVRGGKGTTQGKRDLNLHSPDTAPDCECYTGTRRYGR